jgi:CDP-diglyceride synthetase
VSKLKKGGRVVVGITLGAVIITAILLDVLLSLPLLSEIATLFILLCLAELAKMAKRASRQEGVKSAIGLQALILVSDAVSVWLIQLKDNWLLLFFSVVLPVVCQNVLAYYIGSKLLKNCPAWLERILKFHSFKYSLNEYLGVTIASSLVSLIFAVVLFINHEILAALLAAIGTIFAAPGDYLESRLKRLVGVKDSGKLLRNSKTPIGSLERAMASHGGFLDRFDSLSLCFALAMPVVIFV